MAHTPLCHWPSVIKHKLKRKIMNNFKIQWLCAHEASPSSPLVMGYREAVIPGAPHHQNWVGEEFLFMSQFGSPQCWITSYVICASRLFVRIQALYRILFQKENTSTRKAEIGILRNIQGCILILELIKVDGRPVGWPSRLENLPGPGDKMETILITFFLLLTQIEGDSIRRKWTLKIWDLDTKTFSK